MLEVKDVSKLYENNRGVQQMDFSMSRGEIVGFLGPNGAGKTTTMRMITGYLNPTKGSIIVDGIPMAEDPNKAKRKIGYLPESPPLYPEMTVRSYLQFIADLRKVPVREQKKRIDEVISKLGLVGREKQIIRGLSKGYRQRVGLAQAIVHKPDLLVMDEPTSGLDPKQIIEIRQVIRELGENHTVLLSTHILPEVNAICNRVLIISQGRLVLDARPDEVASTMSEKFMIHVEARGDAQSVRQAIAGLESVQSAELLKDVRTDAGIFRMKVVAKDMTDIREDVFYKLAELRAPILELQRESQTLEDVFLKLTTNEADGDSGKADRGKSGKGKEPAKKEQSEVKADA